MVLPFSTACRGYTYVDFWQEGKLVTNNSHFVVCSRTSGRDCEWATDHRQEECCEKGGVKEKKQEKVLLHSVIKVKLHTLHPPASFEITYKILYCNQFQSLEIFIQALWYMSRIKNIYLYISHFQLHYNKCPHLQHHHLSAIFLTQPPPSLSAVILL